MRQFIKWIWRVDRKILLFILFFGILNHVSGQLHCINYTAQDGLPADVVICAAEDKQGFMWFGTSNGLCRFDGHQFINYSNFGKGDIPAGVFIKSLEIDSSNNVWIGTENQGIYHLDRKKNSWTRYGMELAPPYQLISNEILFLKSFKDGNIWFSCSNGGLGKINWVKGKIESYSLEHLPRKNTWPNRVNDLQEIKGDKSKFNLVGQGYIFQFDTKTESFTTLSKDVKSSNKLNINFSLQSIAAVSKDVFWIGTWHDGIVTFEKGGAKFNNLKLPKAIKDWTERAYVFPKNDDEIWAVFRNHGVLKYDTQSQKFEHYQAEAFNRNGLLNGQFNAIFHSKSGDTWILGSSGISLVIQEHQAFEYFETKIDKNNYFLDIATIPNTENYIAAFSGEDGPVKIYDKDFKIIKRIYFNESTYQSVHKILKYKERIFCVSDLLYEYKSSATILDKFDFKNFKQRSRINDAIILNDHILWILFDNKSVLKYNLETDKFILENLVRHKPLGIDKIMYQGFASIGNEIWIAAKSELVVVDTATLNLKYYNIKDTMIKLCDEQSSENLIGNVSQILNIDDKCAWVINNGFGVFKICNDGQALKVEEFRNKEQLDQLQNPIEIIKDENSGYWIASANGLVKADESMRQFKVYKQREGLRRSKLAQGLERLDDHLFIGMPRGFAKVNINDLESNRPSLTCQIDEASLKEVILNQKHKAFPYDCNDFLAKVSCANFFESKDLVYAHRLINYSEDWIFTETNENRFRYENLPPGKYKFEVKSKSPSLEWSEVASQSFEIKPPFWATTWFRILCLLGVGLIIYLIYKSRMNKAIKEEQIKTEFAELKSQALRAQMNPHFIFNSLNSIKSLVLLDRKQEGITYLTKFSKMVREILQISEQAYIPLEKELEILHLYLEMEQLRFHQKFHYEIFIDSNVNVYKQKIPPMLIQPYVENSIWHGLLHKEGEANLKICITKKNGMQVITIEDNGIGRTASQQLKAKKKLFPKESKGLKINKGRIDLLDSEASVEVKDLYNENEAIGTKVIIKIPDHE